MLENCAARNWLLAWWLPLAGPLQFVGYMVAGRSMDRWGRKPTVLFYLVAASLASAVCYLGDGWIVIAGYFGMAALGGMWAVAQTISAELFPTEVRATAGGVTHNLIGRLGMTLGPKLVGLLAVSVGSTGLAVAMLGLVNLIAVPVIAATLPETRGANLARSLQRS